MSAARQHEPVRFLVGSYTTSLPHVEGRGGGLELFELHPAGPTARRVAGAEAIDVSFLCRHEPSGLFLAAEERVSFQGEPSGSLATYALRGDAELTFVERCSTLGGGPVHVAVDVTGAFALVANYYGGNVVVFGLDGGVPRAVRQVVGHEGSGPDPIRQNGPHPHSVYLHPDSDLVLVPDLGTDEIAVYRFDPDRPEPLLDTEVRVSTAPGAGPRHIATHPSGERIFLVNELDSTVSAYAMSPDALEVLTHLHTVAVAPPGADSTAAEIAIHPSGCRLYASNRGHDSICELVWDEAADRLSVVGHFPSGGRTPRHFALDPVGRFAVIANQDSDSLRIAEIDGHDGRLRHLVDVEGVGTPACVLWV